VRQPEALRELVDAGLDQDAAVLKDAAALPHLGAPHELASLEQNLVGRGTVETDGPCTIGPLCRGFRRERGRDTQPRSPSCKARLSR